VGDLICLKIYDSTLLLSWLNDFTIDCLFTFHTFRALSAKIKRIFTIILQSYKLLAFDLFEYGGGRMEALILVACEALVEYN
jgi:hypothetical protein